MLPRLLPRLVLAFPLALLWPACGGGTASPTPCATNADCVSPGAILACAQSGACCPGALGTCSVDKDCGMGQRCASGVCQLPAQCTNDAGCSSGERCDPCTGLCGPCTPFLGACSADAQCCSALCDHASFTCK